MSSKAQATSSIPLRQIPLSVPYLNGREWTYVKECLDTGWVSSVGSFVERFEDEIAAYTGASHTVAMVNATCGLHIALQIVGVHAGDAVLVSDLTFIAPINAIRYCGAEPIFIDADRNTWQMDVEKLTRFLKTECEIRSETCIHKRSGKRIRAIVPVHILGFACAMDRIVTLAHTYHLKVIEDAAESMGVRYQGRHAGTFGDVGVFSFNGNKIITTGGGGMLVTGQADLAERARYLSTQAKDDEMEYIHDAVGYNYRMTNVQAALGVAQLEQLDHFIQRKQHVAQQYREALGSLSGIVLMPIPPETQATFWLYTVLLPEGTTLIQRKEFIVRLRKSGVQARPLWHPIHSLKPYLECDAYDIKQSDALYARAISLPSSVGMTDDDLQYCINTLRTNWEQ